MKLCIVCSSKIIDQKWFHSHTKVSGSKTLLSELRLLSRVSSDVKTGVVCDICAGLVKSHTEKENKKLLASRSKEETKINAKWNIKACDHSKLARGMFTGCASCVSGIPLYMFDTEGVEGHKELGLGLYAHGLVRKKRGHVCVSCIDSLDIVIEKKMFVSEMGGVEEQLVRSFREMQLRKKRKEDKNRLKSYFCERFSALSKDT